MVITFPSSNGAGFLNELGFAGSGSSQGISSPYPYLSDPPFGEGLPLLTSLNATSGWNWTGPDLQVLAQDSSARQAVWRVTATFD